MSGDPSAGSSAPDPASTEPWEAATLALRRPGIVSAPPHEKHVEQARRRSASDRTGEY